MNHSREDRYLKYDFTSYWILSNVADGPGELAIAVTEGLPQIRATILDLPTVTPITEHILVEALTTEHINVIELDVVYESPEGSFGVAVLRSFIQALTPDEALHALQTSLKLSNPVEASIIRGAF